MELGLQMSLQCREHSQAAEWSLACVVIKLVPSSQSKLQITIPQRCIVCKHNGLCLYHCPSSCSMRTFFLSSAPWLRSAQLQMFWLHENHSVCLHVCVGTGFVVKQNLAFGQSLLWRALSSARHLGTTW